MSTKTVAEAREQFSDTINEVVYTKERIVLTRRGKKAVAIIPMEDLELLEDLEARMDLEEAREVLKDVEKHGTVPWEAVKKRRKP